MAIPKKLVVNCAAWGARAYFQDAAVWSEKADDARVAGDAAFAAHCEAQAEACRTAGRNGLLAAGLPDDPDIIPEAYVELTPDEVEQRKVDEIQAVQAAWRDLRVQRNARLAACDWTELPSAKAKADWAAYRQALRDLPAGVSDPFNVEWPEPPA